MGNPKRELKYCELQYKLQEPLGYKQPRVFTWHDAGLALKVEDSERALVTPDQELMDFLLNKTCLIV
jgi:hypothetical protein